MDSMRGIAHPNSAGRKPAVPLGSAYFAPRLIEIATDCNSVPGAWIEIDC